MYRMSNFRHPRMRMYMRMSYCGCKCECGYQSLLKCGCKCGCGYQNMTSSRMRMWMFFYVPVFTSHCCLWHTSTPSIPFLFSHLIPISGILQHHPFASCLLHSDIQQFPHTTTCIISFLSFLCPLCVSRVLQI